MTSQWRLNTGRLVLSPVGWEHIGAITALKSDPLVYGQMLGGVRGPVLAAHELAEDLAFWARHGVGMWIAHPAAGGPAPAGNGGEAIGLTGIHERTDGRGIALRFAFHPASRGQGLAREAAGAALRFAHDHANLPRVVAVSKESNIASRTVLGAIGMRPCETFDRAGEPMVMYESIVPRGSKTDGGGTNARQQPRR